MPARAASEPVSRGYHSPDDSAHHSAPPMTAPIRVAVLGAGTVGREVIRALLERPETLRAADSAPLELAGVAVRDVAGEIGRASCRERV